MKGFDRRKYITHEDFWKAFSQLCKETPDVKSACKRLRENQELFLEYQTKCVGDHNSILGQALEHAGDIFRELAKCGSAGFCSRVYIDEKIDKLQRRLDELHRD